ncbi:MAG: ComEA family DNA-binding protein [Gemmatimonadales bacterium]
MSPAERRSLTILLALGVAGHLIRAASGASSVPPPVSLGLDPAADGNPLAHRDSARALARPIADTERIDVERATPPELARLPGVGPALAKRIVADRQIHGAFGGIAGLDRVAGIGPAMLRRLVPHLTFAGVAADTLAVGGDPAVDLNRADVAELDALPGIGEARARAIVAFRDSAGPFRQVTDLIRVRGVSQSLIGRLAARLVVR